MQARVMVLVHHTSSDGAFQMCEALSKYLKSFKVVQWTRFVIKNNERKKENMLARVIVLVHDTSSDELFK